MSDVLTRVRSLVDLRRYDAALDELDRLAVDEAGAAEVMCLRAQALLGMDRHGEAASVARQACQAAPDWEWPHRLVAVSEQGRGRHSQALNAATEAARLAPWMLEPRHVLAMAQVNAGAKASAEQTAASLVGDFPQAPLAHETVARVAWSLDRLHLAELAARRALELDPLDDGLQSLLAEILAARGLGQESHALRVEAVRSNPQNAEHRRNLAGALGAATVVAVGAAKAGFLVKALSLSAVIRLPGAVAKGIDAEPATYLMGGCVTLHVLVPVLWGARVERRRRARGTLPAGYWEGLRPERRYSDLGLLKLCGTVTAILSLAAVLVSAWDVATPLAILAGGELAAVVLCRRRLTARYGVTRDRWLLSLSRLHTGRVAQRVAGRVTLEGLQRVGEPTLGQRAATSLGPVYALFAGLTGFLINWWVAVAVLLLVAAAYGLLSDRRPKALGGGAGYRVVISESSKQPIRASTAAVRGMLRVVLLPFLLVQGLIWRRSCRRCLHDRLTGTSVIRVASAFDLLAPGIR